MPACNDVALRAGKIKVLAALVTFIFFINKLSRSDTIILTFEF